jgi:hypothetical protein
MIKRMTTMIKEILTYLNCKLVKLPPPPTTTTKTKPTDH